MAIGPLSRNQVLDQLQFLVTVEHALIVEYLSVCCALGHDLKPEDGGATTKQGRDAADAASVMAQGGMYQLKGLMQGLSDADRFAELKRAASISSASGAEIALGPPSAAQLERLLEREEAIALAVDERYARLRPAVTSDPVFSGDLLDHLRYVIEEGSTRAAAVAGLRQSLGDLAPADFLRATRREATDPFERRLLNVSDQSLVQRGLLPPFTLAGSRS
jgi:hypothetical protein